MDATEGLLVVTDVVILSFIGFLYHQERLIEEKKKVLQKKFIAPVIRKLKPLERKDFSMTEQEEIPGIPPENVSALENY